MIAAIFSNPWLVITIIGGPLFTGFICIFNSLYLCRYLPAILKALENSRQVALYSEMFQCLGLSGRTLLLHLVSSMLIWPKLEIRGGFLDPHDVANFPRHILRLLKINTTLLVVSVVWLIVVGVILELR